MEQIKQLFDNLSWRQKLSLAGAVLAVALGLWLFVRHSHESDFKPLFSGLAPEDAGQVIARLKESNVEYRVGENGSLLVPSARVAELRLQLASAGLPKTGRIGFELFDKTSFGQTEFAEQVNYRRALEGELERSIAALTEVETARIHLVFPKDSVFLEARQPAKASVLIKLKPGAKLSPANVNAITHLTASAVEGLTPEAVSVLDMNGSLLSRPRRVGMETGDASDETLEYRERIERTLLAKVNSTLEPLLGPDRFRAGVTVDCDFTSGEQSEETFDPAKSVMASSQKTEDIGGTVTPAGVPGTPSALPRPTGRSAGGTNLTRRTENINYQTSRMVKRLKLPQGNLKRVSVSVLLDQRVRWEGSGPKAKRILEVLPPEKIKSIHDLVAGVAGVVPERGDQVVVESLPFDATLNAEPPANPVDPKLPGDQFPAWWPSPLRSVGVLAGVGVALVVVVAAAGLWLSRRKKLSAVVAADTPELASGDPETEEAALPAGMESAAVMKEKLAQQIANKEQRLLESMQRLESRVISSNKSEALAKHLTVEAAKSPEAFAQLIRTWLMEGKQ